MPRIDPLLLWTLLGLAGAGLLATLHPTEPLDPHDPLTQAGRQVTVRLLVTESQAGREHVRGEAYALDHAGSPTGPTIDWIWFRAPLNHTPQAGDRLDGHALVERGPAGASLVLDGALAAAVTPGPHPVPVGWSDLLGHPERLSGRDLVLRGQLTDTDLVAPGGAHSCPVPPDDANAYAGLTHVPTWTVRLARQTDAPGWVCHVQGPGR